MLNLEFCSIADKEDPLKKREQFAVSLRETKKKEIIAAKRRKMINSIASKSTGFEHGRFDLD